MFRKTLQTVEQFAYVTTVLRFVNTAIGSSMVDLEECEALCSRGSSRNRPLLLHRTFVILRSISVLGHPILEDLSDCCCQLGLGKIEQTTHMSCPVNINVTDKSS